MKYAAILLIGCAAGPHDVLDGTSQTSIVDAGAKPAADAYVAKRPLVAVGLAGSEGLGDADTHRVVDQLADEASACFKRSQHVVAGAGRITIDIDEGGVSRAPNARLTPQTAVALGMVCVLAPLRLMTFAPSTAGAPRSITVDAAWGTDIAP